MTRETMCRRAIAKAVEVGPAVFAVDTDFFAVQSSDPGRGYLLERDPETGDLFCPCEASQRGLPCYHRAALGLFLGTIPAHWLPGVDAPVALEVVAVAS